MPDRRQLKFKGLGLLRTLCRREMEAVARTLRTGAGLAYRLLGKGGLASRDRC